jgi:hypothetical protein
MSSVNWILQKCKVQNNTSVSKCANRGSRGTSRLSHDIAITVNWDKYASNSSNTEQALWAWLTGLDQHGQRPWPVREAEGGEEKEKITHTSRPSADLAGMARQCPRGQPGATEGRLHRNTPGAPPLALPPTWARVAQALELARHAQQPQRRGTSSAS